MNRFDLQNLVIGISIPVFLFALLALGSHSDNPFVIAVGLILFSFLGLSVEQVTRLREEYSIYTVNSARANIASFNQSNLCIKGPASATYFLVRMILDGCSQLNNITDDQFFLG